MLDFVKHLEALKHEPQWLKDERSAAWEKFSQLPMPTQSEEAWRLLDLNTMDLEKLAIVPYKPQQTNSLKNIDALFEESKAHLYWGKQIKQYIEETAAIIVESPQGIWIHLDEEIARQGVICTTVPEAVTKHADLIQSFLTKAEESNQSDKFTALNQAFCHAGIFIYVPANVVISKPFVCLNLFGTDSMSRFVLLAGKHSKLSAINILTDGEQAGKPLNDDKNKQYTLVNYALQMHIQPGAQVDYAEVQDFNDNTFAIYHSNYCLERDSQLTALIAAFGAGQLKDEIRTVLKDRGAECTVNGIVLGNKNECFNVSTIDDHDAPDTKSSIDFRVVLKDQAKSIYHGIIEVAKEAQKTNAFQSNKNLLLGEKAHADSIPKLEILADDVKCSHGATVGPVDRNQLFYLMSRGLNASKAEELIVSGFFHQLIGDCKIEGVSDWLDSLLANKIENSIINEDINLSTKKEPIAAPLSVSHKKGQPALVK